MIEGIQGKKKTKVAQERADRQEYSIRNGMEQRNQVEILAQSLEMEPEGIKDKAYVIHALANIAVKGEDSVPLAWYSKDIDPSKRRFQSYCSVANEIVSRLTSIGIVPACYVHSDRVKGERIGFAVIVVKDIKHLYRTELGKKSAKGDEAYFKINKKAWQKHWKAKRMLDLL